MSWNLWGHPVQANDSETPAQKTEKREHSWKSQKGLRWESAHGCHWWKRLGSVRHGRNRINVSALKNLLFISVNGPAIFWKRAARRSFRGEAGKEAWNPSSKLTKWRIKRKITDIKEGEKTSFWQEMLPQFGNSWLVLIETSHKLLGQKPCHCKGETDHLRLWGAPSGVVVVRLRDQNCCQR